MRIVVGVDPSSEYRPALHLIRNLGFPRTEVLLVHASSSIMPFAPMDYQAAAAAQHEYMLAAERIGKEALEEAQSLACSIGRDCTTRLASGAAAPVLLKEAESADADLIAVCSMPHSKLGAAFLGSVGKALTISSPQSLIVAKGHVASQKPLRAVLATDHSRYATRWIQEFLQFGARGISEIHVVTAVEFDETQIGILEANLPEYAGELRPWLLKQAQQRSDELVSRLAEYEYRADCRVVDGTPNEVIRDAMQNTGADLLIMGAQGHGFFERLLIGSVAMHQVMSEPYPVMVVRPHTLEA